ncbi:hypothetical protein Ahy_A02g008421 [Arachis hypogaea]|uniref:Auxin-induced protein n=1 Tax=Arachis hypogaea TaxID=3818 RepID=A0A445EEY7_ARAHY|nr:hypothetical protein Ahy_A02g008421 [Arachis hypogaea]
MAFRILGIGKASLSASKGTNIPKGYLAVYVGDKMRRFVIPVCYLNQPSFQGLLNQAEEEFGYDHPTCGLTIPCGEDEPQFTASLKLCLQDSSYIYITSCVLNQHKSVASPQVLELTYFSQTKSSITMAFRIPSIRKASLSASKGTNVPKGYLAVYMGDKMGEEEFGYDHPTGGLTIPCSEDTFLNLTCQISGQMIISELFLCLAQQDLD